MCLRWWSAIGAFLRSVWRKIGDFKLFEVELKLKSEQPIFERRRRHSVREWELVDERCKSWKRQGSLKSVTVISLPIQ
jgi:hypothetical protein